MCVKLFGIHHDYVLLEDVASLMRRFSRGRLWPHKDFMRLWSAETIGAFGRQVTAFTLPPVAIFLLNAGPLEMGILFGLEDLAFPILGLLVGVWADRWRRRPMMIAANIGRMVAVSSVPVVFLFAKLHMYTLYMVAFAIGVFTVFFDISYQSYLPTLIERTDLIEGNSKLETSQSGARTVSPAITGFLIDLVGKAKAAEVIAADAVAFFVSAVLIFSITKRESKLEAIGERKFLIELKEGARAVFGNPILSRIAACTAMLNLGSGIFFVVFYLFVYNQLKLSTSALGLILAFGSVGLVIGAISAPRFLKALGLGRSLVVSVFLSGLGLVVVPLAQYGAPIPILIALLMASNVPISVYNINQISLRQAITPDRLQGRMNATMRTFVWGVLPVGAFVGGILGANIGIVWTLVIGALVSMLGTIWVLLPPVISLRDIPQI